MRPPLTALFMVKDEADRLPEGLASVAWADEVVVADTGSSDATRELASRAGARVASIPWEGYVASRNRALALASHDWVLFLDADERVTPALRGALEAALERAGESVAGASMPRLAHYQGRPVRHGVWYPDRKLRLGRRSRGFRCEGARVHERMAVDGAVDRLEEPLLHFPFRDLEDAVRRQTIYARLSAEERFERGERAGLGSLLVRPCAELLRSYVWKLGLLDGRAGAAVALLHAGGYVMRAGFLMEAERHQAASAGTAEEKP